jgi:hypothetical protein
MSYTPKHTVSKVLDASIKGESIQSLDLSNNATLKSFWSSVNETKGFDYSIKGIEDGWNERVFLVNIVKINYDQENQLTSIIQGALTFQLSRSLNSWSITDIKVINDLTES